MGLGRGSSQNFGGYCSNAVLGWGMAEPPEMRAPPKKRKKLEQCPTRMSKSVTLCPFT